MIFSLLRPKMPPNCYMRLAASYVAKICDAAVGWKSRTRCASSAPPCSCCPACKPPPRATTRCAYCAWRANGRVRKSGGAKRAKAIVRPTIVVAEDALAEDARLADDIYWDDYYEVEVFGPVRGPEFARVVDHLPGFDELRVPDLLPASPIQLPLIEYALARRVRPDELVGSIRGRLSEATVRQLLVLGERRPIELAAAERDFFARYDLTQLCDWLQQPDRSAATQRLSIVTGYELAGIALVLNYGVTLAAFDIDWAAVTDWLLDRLAQAPAEDYDASLLAGYVFGLHAPLPALRTLAAALDQVRTAWLPLLFAWAARRRSASIALKRPLDTSHARGLAGRPSRGHCSNATRNASCSASSARSKSPSKRIRVARMRRDSA